MLKSRTASLVRLSASLATRDEGRIREALERARREAPAEAVEEVLLQSYLFLGFPAALGALALWREVSPGAEADRTALEAAEAEIAAVDRAEPDPTEADTTSRRMERGERVCRIVYGDRYDALRANIRALHPEMERWMLEEGYGKVLSRDGLDLESRELAVAALLAVLEMPVQLHSHLRGALNAGAEPGVVEAALDVAREYQTEEGRRVAEETWRRVRRPRH